jgi:phage replication O-like protein O
MSPAAIHQIADHQHRSPQLENGFLRLSNELNQAICRAHLSGNEFAVLMALAAKTYGYQKKTDDVSASQLGEYCDLARNHVTEVLNSLAARNIITKRIGKFGCILGIQKDYSQWLAKPKRALRPKKEASPSYGLEGEEVVRVTDSASPSYGLQVVRVTDTQKTTPKDNQQKTTRSGKISLRTFLAKCKAESKKPIPEGDAVFKYADEVGIPLDFIRFAWVEFKRKYTQPRAKTYIDWNQHFQNAVRENWYHIWFIKDDGYQLTTRGLQIQKEIKETA